MSEAQEIALGAQYDPSVISTLGVYDQPQLLDFITTKGTEMGEISHRPNLEYHIKSRCFSHILILTLDNLITKFSISI